MANLQSFRGLHATKTGATTVTWSPSPHCPAERPWRGVAPADHDLPGGPVPAALSLQSPHRSVEAHPPPAPKRGTFGGRRL